MTADGSPAAPQPRRLEALPVRRTVGILTAILTDDTHRYTPDLLPDAAQLRVSASGHFLEGYTSLMKKRMENLGANSDALGLGVLCNRYFVMRHGESEANVFGVAVGDPQRGVKGFGLTELGREQVVQAAKKFKEEYGPQLDATEIVASDFRRTRETAELLAQGLGGAIPVHLREGLRERFFGEMEGKEHATMAALLQREGIEALIRRYGCESAESVQSRVVEVIRELDAEKRDKTLILVSHADPIQLLMAACTGLDVSEHERIAPLGYAELAELSDMPFRLQDDRMA